MKSTDLNTNRNHRLFKQSCVYVNAIQTIFKYINIPKRTQPWPQWGWIALFLVKIACFVFQCMYKWLWHANMKAETTSFVKRLSVSVRRFVSLQNTVETKAFICRCASALECTLWEHECVCVLVCSVKNTILISSFWNVFNRWKRNSNLHDRLYFVDCKFRVRCKSIFV